MIDVFCFEESIFKSLVLYSFVNTKMVAWQWSLMSTTRRPSSCSWTLLILVGVVNSGSAWLICSKRATLSGQMGINRLIETGPRVNPTMVICIMNILASSRQQSFISGNGMTIPMLTQHSQQWHFANLSCDYCFWSSFQDPLFSCSRFNWNKISNSYTNVFNHFSASIAPLQFSTKFTWMWWKVWFVVPWWFNGWSRRLILQQTGFN